MCGRRIFGKTKLRGEAALELIDHHEEERHQHDPTVIAKIIPKNTPVPIEWRLAEPGPEAITIGNIPSTNASDVIRIGRKRNCAA